MSSPDEVIIRGLEEVVDAIRSLTPAQAARLRIVADRYAYAMPADDLLQETFTRVLEGKRNCPMHIDIVRFLAEVMRSIASDEYEKKKDHPNLVSVISPGDQDGDAVDPSDPTICADDWLVREQHAVQCRKKILALFSDDQQAYDIIEGRMAEMDADELRELTGLDAVGYASKLKLIRRRIDKSFPKGWR